MSKKPIIVFEGIEGSGKTLHINALANYLKKNKIPYGIFYPVPLHLQKAYVNIKFKNENFINTNKVVNEVISLPMHTELTYSQIEFICEKTINFLDK